MDIDRNGIGRVAVMVLPQSDGGMEAAFDTTRQFTFTEWNNGRVGDVRVTSPLSCK